MSRVSQNDITDEEGQDLLRSVLPKELFFVDVNGSSDKTPDFDGLLRLRDGKGNYLNEFVLFQLKSTKKANTKSINLTKSTVEFLCDSSVPTILFVADVSAKIVYWHIVDIAVASKRKTKGLRVELSESISLDTIKYIHSSWRSIARKSNLTESNEKLRAISSDYLNDLRSVIGLLHLLKRARRKTFPSIASQFFGIDPQQIGTLLVSLEKQGIVTVTTNYLLINDQQLGEETSVCLTDSDKADLLFQLLPEHGDRLLLVRSILERKDSWTEQWAKQFARKIARNGHESEKYTEMFHSVALLRELTSRIPAEALVLLKPFAHIEQAPKLSFKSKVKSGDYKDAEDVIFSACEGMLYLLLIEGSVLDEVWKVFVSSNQNLKDKIKHAFKEIVGYDLNAIRNVGFAPQKTAIDFLNRLDETDIADNIDFVCDLCSQLLKPSFESKRMLDWKTFQFEHGALPATEELEVIREKVVSFLVKVFRSSQNHKTRERVIYALGDATEPSHFGKPTESHKAMVLKNVATVISFFKTQLPSMEIREIFFVEEQLKTIERYFGRENVPSIVDLKEAIKNVSEYQVIESLIGWGYLPTEAQKKAHDERLTVMFDDISNKSFDAWKKRFEFLARDRDLLSSKGYVVLLDFIRRVGREKSDIAKRLLGASKLKLVFPSLLCGIEEANEQTFLKQWIGQNLGKYTEQVAEFFRMSPSPDWSSFYGDVYKIGSSRDNPIVLRNVLDSIVFKKLNDSRHFSLALTIIQRLSELKDPFWTSTFSREEFLAGTKIDKKAAQAILRALLLSRKLEYHEVQIINHLGTRHHLLVIDFLIARIRYQRENDLDWLEYDAIPFNLDGLEDVLTKEPGISIEKLSPLLIEKDPRLGGEVKQIFEKALSQHESEFEKAIDHLIERPNPSKVEIAARLLRQIDNKDSYCQLARKILETNKASAKAKDEICYHIATFEELPGEVTNWENVGISSLAKAVKGIRKYKAEFEQRKKEWEAQREAQERLQGIDEHEELRKRGLSD